jgi:hypothetical protein
MYLLKGGLLGLVVFVFASITYVFISQQRGLPPHSAIGLGLIRLLTVYSAYWWLALVGAILIGIWFVRT